MLARCVFACALEIDRELRLDDVALACRQTARVDGYASRSAVVHDDDGPTFVVQRAVKADSVVALFHGLSFFHRKRHHLRFVDRNGRTEQR